VTVAQVRIYDGAFERVGEVVTAADLRRTYSLHNRDSARFVVDLADAQAANLDPRKGHVLVITSASYPWPWVGKVSTLRASMESGQLRVDARSYAAVLDERFLGRDAVFSEAAGRAFTAIVGALGERNPHGIGLGSVAQTERRFDGALPFQSGRAALDTVAKVAGMEWWISPRVSGSQLRVSAHLATVRGVSRYGTTTLVHGSGMAAQEWLIDGLAASFAATVVGGQSSPIQSFGDRATARATAAPSDIGGVHGFKIESSASSSLVSRREQIVFAESLRGQGRVEDAARVAVAKPTAQRRMDLIVSDAALWPSLGVGDLLRCQVPGAFLGDLDAAVRVLSVEVREEAGEVAVVTQIMGGKL